MNKVFAILASAVIVAGITGCTPEQQKAVSRQLGIASAVSWIGIDNPKEEDIATVKTVVEVIKTACCTNSVAGDSYYARVYPIIDQYIGEKVPANKQPMARLGASFILTSLDTVFAMNPSWQKDAGTATTMVEAYCEGVETGLSMSATDPVRIAATRQSAMRVGTLKLIK